MKPITKLMESSIFSFALPTLILSSFTLSFNSVITDKHSLISFKNSITSDPYAILSTNWSQNTSVCNWVGVSCGLKHGRVTALNLSGYDLAGTVDPHLGNLTFLRCLDISSNSFTGILPCELSKLRRLKVMNAGVNSFTGEIPTWLSNLPQLEELYLYNTTFFGTIPASLFNIFMLQVLDLSNNQLSGFMPHAIFNVSSLKEIKMIAYQDSFQMICATICPKSKDCQSIGTDLKGRFRQISGNAHILRCYHYPSTISMETSRVKSGD